MELYGTQIKTDFFMELTAIIGKLVCVATVAKVIKLTSRGCKVILFNQLVL